MPAPRPEPLPVAVHASVVYRVPLTLAELRRLPAAERAAAEVRLAEEEELMAAVFAGRAVPRKRLATKAQASKPVARKTLSSPR